MSEENRKKEETMEEPTREMEKETGAETDLPETEPAAEQEEAKKAAEAKEAETADQYIERTVHKIGRKHNVTVATSDGLEQIIIMGAGAHRLSARDLRTEIEHTNGQIRENYLEKEQKTKSYLLENASGELGDFLKELEEERKKESKKSKGKA